jgi:hypothetical protein
LFNSKAGFWIAEQVQEKVNSFEAFTPAWVPNYVIGQSMSLPY